MVAKKCLIDAIDVVKTNQFKDEVIPALTGWEVNELKSVFIKEVFGYEEKMHEDSLFNFLNKIAGLSRIDDLLNKFHTFSDLYLCLRLLVFIRSDEYNTYNLDFCMKVFSH